MPHSSRRLKALTLPALPPELYNLIRDASEAPEQAALLRVSKLCYQLGLKALYREIWIPTPTGVEKLAHTLLNDDSKARAPGQPKLAELIQRLEVLLARFSPGYDSRSHNLHFSKISDNLALILLKTKNLTRLQLLVTTHASHRMNVMPPWLGRATRSCTFDKLTSLTLGPHLGDGVDSVQALLRGCAETLEHLSVHSPTEYRIGGLPTSLPNLRSYSGDAVFLKSLAESSPKLEKVVLDLTPLVNSETVIELGIQITEDLQFLKGLGAVRRRRRESGEQGDVDDEEQGSRGGKKTLSSLTIKYRVPEALNLVLPYLPDVEELSFACMALNSSATPAPVPDPSSPWLASLDIPSLALIPCLKKFSYTTMSFHRRKTLPWDLAVHADTLGKSCKELTEVELYGFVYRKTRSNTTTAVAEGTGENSSITRGGDGDTNAGGDEDTNAESES